MPLSPHAHAAARHGATTRWLAIVAALAFAPAGAIAAQHPATQGLHVPVEYHTLSNGLKVVMSPDSTTPTAVVAVYYNIGFRNEPKDRTGFAHLFEHMMFQGSEHLGKMEFIKLVESNGGVLNGTTRFDFTNYFEVVPSHKLETVLWAEADRMRGLKIDSTNLENQQEVVKNEVRVNVLNQPYGGFPWIDLPMAANTNWHNAHNFYGDLEHLDAATLEDVRSFFTTYYAPNNAVLVMVGDFQPAPTLALVKKYFESIPSVPQPPKPDLTEPRQTQEKRASRTDSLARRPALALGYHVPPRYTPEWYAFGLLDQILAQGRDSRFYDEVVRKRSLTSNVAAGINYGLGNMFDYNGPMLWIVTAFHDSDKPADSLVAAMDSAIASVRDRPVDRATLDRALVKLRSQLYSQMESFVGFGKANLLASFALFDDDPSRINRLEADFAKVTPALIQKTAQEYLRPTNRTIYTIVPAARAAGNPTGQ
ncbi:MAG TPA: pitrilysin family protein [Gemmatimonadaceae bacterium]|jgi:predicted Zn-dependent peptidase|nr:pitrilysin family protein [Gemmatimonadaceae bacterium]